MNPRTRIWKIWTSSFSSFKRLFHTWMFTEWPVVVKVGGGLGLRFFHSFLAICNRQKIIIWTFEKTLCFCRFCLIMSFSIFESIFWSGRGAIFVKNLSNALRSNHQQSYRKNTLAHTFSSFFHLVALNIGHFDKKMIFQMFFSQFAKFP